MRRVRKIALIVTTGLALLLTVCSYFVDTWPFAPVKIRLVYDLLSTIELPAGLAGVLVSRNPHDPDSFTFYLVLFATYWLLAASSFGLCCSQCTEEESLVTIRQPNPASQTDAREAAHFGQPSQSRAVGRER